MTIIGHIIYYRAIAPNSIEIMRVLIERISIVGIALVMLLFAIGLTNDINRFTGP